MFCAHPFRTDQAAHAALSELLDCRIISLKLVDPRFYHLDTCFCPLSDGALVWYPSRAIRREDVQLSVSFVAPNSPGLRQNLRTNLRHLRMVTRHWVDAVELL